MPIIRQTVGFVVAWMTVFGKNGVVKESVHTVSLYLSFQIDSGSSVVSLLLFLTGSCFYVKKKPQRPSCRCTISKTHIHTEVRI